MGKLKAYPHKFIARSITEAMDQYKYNLLYSLVLIIDTKRN